MAAGTTQYDVILKYQMQDQATRGALGLDRSLRQASASSIGLGSALKAAAFAGAGILGLKGGYDSLIKFNSSLEQAKGTMAGMIELTTKKDFNESLAISADLVGKLQVRARDSVGTTADMVEMASRLTQPVLAAGLGMKDLEDITASAVVASKALGVEAEVGARDIDQAIRGQFRAVDQLTGKLLGSMGYLGEEGRKRFNEMDMAARAATVRAALTQKAILDLAKYQAGTFEGVMSSFQDTLQMTLGSIGKPLFEAITNELKSWNAWLDANQKTVSAWAKDFSHALVQGFSLAKDVLGWIVANKDTLLAIAKGWLAFKGVSMVGAGVGSIATFTSSLSSATSALGLFAAATTTLASLLEKDADERRGAQTRTGTLFGHAEDFAKGKLTRAEYLSRIGGRAQDEGFISRTGQFDRAAFMQTAMRGSEWSTPQQMMARMATMNQLAADLGIRAAQMGLDAAQRQVEAANLNAASMALFNQSWTPIKASIDLAKIGMGPTKLGGNVNVTIHRIEVQSEDPDRYVHGLMRAFSDAVKNPSQAVRAMREG